MQDAHKIDVYGLSVRGDQHDKNHDHFAIATLSKSMRLHQSNLTIDDDSRVHGHNQGHLFLVADGISGGPAPARASGKAVDAVVQYFLNEMPWYHLVEGEPHEVTDALEDALRNAQDELFSNAGPGRSGLGTTMTLAFVFWPHLFIAHVGDSRCYLFRDDELRQLTTDHTLAEVRRDIGGRVTKRSESILWNAVGGRNSQLQPEVHHEVLQTDDRLVLVTDGVTQERSAFELQTALGLDASAERLCDRLVADSGDDDRTAIVVRFRPPERIGVESAEQPVLDPLAERRTVPAPRHHPPRSDRERRSSLRTAVAAELRAAK